MGAVIHKPGEGELLEMGPTSLTLHAVSDDTADTFFLSETEVAPGFPGPPLHVHERIHDMFYVLDGTLMENCLVTRPWAGCSNSRG